MEKIRQKQRVNKVVSLQMMAQSSGVVISGYIPIRLQYYGLYYLDILIPNPGGCWESQRWSQAVPQGLDVGWDKEESIDVNNLGLGFVWMCYVHVYNPVLAF